MQEMVIMRPPIRPRKESGLGQNKFLNGTLLQRSAIPKGIRGQNDDSSFCSHVEKERKKKKAATMQIDEDSLSPIMSV